MEKYKGVLKNVTKVILGIFAIFSIVVALRVLYVSENTPEQVAKIHATKLTMDDVMGVNLPPDPGADADKTVEGIDANENGIRDDVELAIFKEYPDSAKTRAVLLQYALALQMGVEQPIINRETVTEVVVEQSRADSCVSDTLVPRKSPESSRNNSEIKKIELYISFIKDKQFNTDNRKQARKEFLRYIGSYGESENEICDVSLLILPN